MGERRISMSAQNDLTIEQIELLLGQMKNVKKIYPNANVIYDINREQVIGYFNLPEDFRPIDEVLEMCRRSKF